MLRLIVSVPKHVVATPPVSERFSTEGNRFRRRLWEAANAQPGTQAHMFEGLKRIKPTELVSKGRDYGAGLYEVEP
jgi:hypothetical protein